MNPKYFDIFILVTYKGQDNLQVYQEVELQLNKRLEHYEYNTKKTKILYWKHSNRKLDQKKFDCLNSSKLRNPTKINDFIQFPNISEFNVKMVYKLCVNECMCMCICVFVRICVSCMCKCKCKLYLKYCNKCWL